MNRCLLAHQPINRQRSLKYQQEKVPFLSVEKKPGTTRNRITNVSKAKKTQPHKQQRREEQKMSE